MAISNKLGRVHPKAEEIIRVVKPATKEGTFHASEETLRAISGGLYSLEDSAIQRALAVMLNELYDYDLGSLEADIAKIILLEGDKLVGQEDRLKLLRAFWWIISVYFKGDTAKAVQACTDVRYLKPRGSGVSNF